MNMKIKSLVLLFAVICSVGAKILTMDNVKVANLKVVPCDADSEKVAKLLNISVSFPNGAKVQIDGKFENFQDVQGPVQLEFAAHKKVGVWFPIPCAIFESCVIPDLCKLVESHPCQPGAPCRCPVKKGTYSIPPLDFLKPQSGLEILSGSYKANVKLHEGSALKLISCYNAEFDLVPRS